MNRIHRILRMQNTTSSIFSKVLVLLFILNILDQAYAQSRPSNSTSISTNYISSCKYGYFYSNNQCHQCLVSCSRCVDLVTPCAGCGEAQTFNDDSKICLPCKIGQLWCSNNSITCQPHYYLEGKQCKPICAVQNCKSCPNIFSNICTQCKTGYTLTKNSTCSVSANSPTKRNLQSSNSTSPAAMIPVINNSSAIKQVSKIVQQQYNQTLDVTPVQNISFQASKTQEISNFTGIIKGVVDNKTSSAASSINIPALTNETVPSLKTDNIPQFNSSTIPTLSNDTKVIVNSQVANKTSSSPSVDISPTSNIPTPPETNKTESIVNTQTSTIELPTQNSIVPPNNQSMTTNSTPAIAKKQEVGIINSTTSNNNNSITDSNSNNTTIVTTQVKKNSSQTINVTTQPIEGAKNSTVVANNSIETTSPTAVIPVSPIATTTTNTSAPNNDSIATANTSSSTIPPQNSTVSKVDFSKVGPPITPPAPPSPPPKPKQPPLSPSSTQKQILKDTSIGENIQNVVLPIEMIEPMCQVGYYPSGVECRKCEAKCATCINSAGQCLQCASGWRRLGWKCVANEGLGFTFNLLVPPVLVSQALPSNTTIAPTDSPTDLTAYISQLKSYLLQSCLPKEYSSLSGSILTLQNLKQSGRSFTISGIIDKISPISLNQLQSSLTQKLKKTNNIGNVVLSDFKLYPLGAGLGGFDGKASAETIVPDKQNKTTKILVPILIGLAVLLSLITAFCCYKKKKCCFKDKQEEPNIKDYQNEQKGPTQRAFYPRNTQMMNYHRPKQATATELVQQHADQKQKQKQGYNYEYEIQSDDQRAGAMRDTYNSQGIQVVDYEKGHGVEGKGYQPRLF